jgi:hypothetical protein
MFIGVLAFSYAQGTLANLMQSHDQHSVIFNEKMNILEKLQKDHDLPSDLVCKLKKNIKFNFSEDLDAINDYVEELPYNLKAEVSIYIYEKVYRKVNFIRTKN